MDSSRKDLKKFPVRVCFILGKAIYQAQQGMKHVDAKPLQGFGSAGVLEIKVNYRGNTYRAIYTVLFSGTVYILHAFIKKIYSSYKNSQNRFRFNPFSP